MKPQGEIALLSGILTDSDPPDPEKRSACPAPAVLWALVEDIPPEGSALIAGLREHVAHCERCAELARRFQGFESLEKTAAPQGAPAAEAAWAVAASRMSSRVEQALKRRADSRQTRKPAWFWAWLPSFQINRLSLAYAGGGLALVAAVTIASITYFGRTEPDAGVLQSQTAPDAAARESASAAPKPEAAALPSANAASADASLPAGAISPSLGQVAGRTPGRNSAAAAVGASTAPNPDESADTMLLLAGQPMHVTIGYAQSAAEGGVRVQGELAPAGHQKGKAGESAFFSALVAGPGAVKLTVRSFRLNGREFRVQNGGATEISVSWPTESGSPSVGQSFEVRVVSGGVLRGGNPQK